MPRKAKVSASGQRLIRVRNRNKRTMSGAPAGYEPRPMFIDYKDVNTLKKFVTGQGKLMSRKRTGLSAAAQRCLSKAIKRARFMALLPYVGD